jgi:two-component system NarL family sensor kinase
MQKSTEVYFVTILGIILGLLLAGFIIMILVLYQRRQRRQETEMERMKDQFEKEALRSQLEIQENTFKTIAQELHDNIGQMLSVVKLSLSALPVDKAHPAMEPIRNSQEILNKAIFDLSNLTKSLHTERIADIGLVESIRYELYAIKRAGIVDVAFNAKGIEVTFSEQQLVFLFRIFQEVINNILKHAAATNITVELEYLEKEFVMMISDNGKGFDVAAKRESSSSGSGVGLRSLYNRASIIGANLSIESSPGQGSTIVIKLSLPEEKV